MKEADPFYSVPLPSPKSHQSQEHTLENIRTLFYIAKNGPVFGEYKGFGPKEADELLETIANLLGVEELPKLSNKEWRPPDDYTLDRDTW